PQVPGEVAPQNRLADRQQVDRAAHQVPSFGDPAFPEAFLALVERNQRLRTLVFPPARGEEAKGDGEDQQSGGRGRRGTPVAADEIPDARRPGAFVDRIPTEEAAERIGHLLGGRIAVLGTLAETAHADPFQVAWEAFAEPPGPGRVVETDSAAGFI